MKEYIVAVEDDVIAYEEYSVGYIRRQKKLIRCKDCKYYNPQQHYCEGIGSWFGYDDAWGDNGYCYKAEPKVAK